MSDQQFGDMTINSIVNLWYEGLAPLALSMLILGLFLVWIHRRVSTSPVFGRLGELMVANGVVMLLFFRNKFPHPIILVLEIALAVGAAIYATAILADFLLIRMPEWGIPEKALFEPEDHRIKPWFVPTLAFTEIFLLWLIPGILGDKYYVSAFFRLESHLLGDLLSWFVMILIVALMSLCAFELLPYRRVRETALLGETAPPMELDNVFVVNGPVTKMELIATPTVVLTVWAVACFFTMEGKRAGTSWFGLLLLVFLGASIARIEYQRWKRKERLAAASRTSEPMTQEA